jgi:transcriptional regulator with XRE-family HTH domain
MKTRSDNEQQLKEYVPANIKNLRDGRGLTQVQLSKQLLAKNPKCGLTPNRISDIEIKRSTIYFMEVIAFAAFFDCDPEALLEKPAAMEHGSLSMDSVGIRCYEVENRCYEIENRCQRLESAQHTLNVQRETDARAVAESMNYLEKRCYELEQANTTLKARVDFIVEAINTLQDNNAKPEELF